MSSNKLAWGIGISFAVGAVGGGVVAIDRHTTDVALTATGVVFGARMKLSDPTPLREGSNVSVSGREVARLLTQRLGTALPESRTSATIAIYQGQRTPAATNEAFDGMAARLIRTSGQPPYVSIELISSSDCRDSDAMGQVWIEETRAIWLCDSRGG